MCDNIFIQYLWGLQVCMFTSCYWFNLSSKEHLHETWPIHHSFIWPGCVRTLYWDTLCLVWCGVLSSQSQSDEWRPSSLCQWLRREKVFHWHSHQSFVPISEVYLLRPPLHRRMLENSCWIWFGLKVSLSSQITSEPGFYLWFLQFTICDIFSFSL